MMSPLRRESSVFGLPPMAPTTPVGNSERQMLPTISSFDGSDADIAVSCLSLYDLLDVFVMFNDL
jgi:hypothetical protein